MRIIVPMETKVHGRKHVCPFLYHPPTQQPPVVGRGWLSTGKDKVARTPQIPFVLLLLLFEKQEWRGRFHVSFALLAP